MLMIAMDRFRVPTGRVKFIVLAMVCTLTREAPALQQPLSLSANIGKEEFFEDEPIYAVFRLTNTGPDTAWLGRFELMPEELDLALTRSDGAVVPRVTVSVDYVTDPSSRGDPLAPGGRRFLLLVLQNRYGVEPRPGPRVFDKYLPPGRYILTATFNPHATSLPVVVMAPVSLTIRPRTPAEDASFGEVARVMSLWWDRAQQAQYVAALEELADRRLKANDADPYLAYLLNEGVVKAAAAALPVDTARAARLESLCVLTALAQRARPSGALAARAAFFRGAWNMRPTLSERLGSSLAGDVVRMHEARDLLYLKSRSSK
jgi:hypothetical protein